MLNTNYGRQLSWRQYNNIQDALKAEWESFKDQNLYNIIAVLSGGVPYIFTLSREGIHCYGYYKYYGLDEIHTFKKVGDTWTFDSCVLNSRLFTIKGEYTITNGAIVIHDNRIEERSRIFVTVNYHPGSGVVNYFINAQPLNGVLNVYVRNKDGSVLNGVTIYLSILVVKI